MKRWREIALIIMELSLGRSETVKFAAKCTHAVLEKSQYCDSLETGGCYGAESFGR